jgi:arylsulfatase A-like enzyme
MRLILLLAGFLGLFISDASAQRRPNVLILFADDLRADALGCYGNPYVITPNIDRLATEGTQFTRAYILGGDQGAVCAPSRAMLLSGKSFFRVSDKLKGELTLPDYLRKNGYETFMTGKWHNEKEVVARGFDQARNLMFAGMSDHFQVPTQDLRPDGTFTEVTRKGFSTDIFGETAMQFLDQHDPKKPFFAYIPFTAPHDPRSPLPQYRKLYDEKGVPLPANFMPLHPFSFGNSMGIRDEFLAAYPRTPETIRSQTAEYYGLITHLDEVIGKILAKLKEKGLEENTLVIFAADNGLALGSHGLLGKQNLYEHSMHVPLIVKGRRIPAGRQSDAFVYLLDLFPTLCSYAGLPVPAGMDGKDLNPVLSGKSDGVRSELFTAYMSFQRSVRDGRYKLIRYPKVNYTQLFDLEHDPWELANLADKPEHAERVRKMTELLEKNQHIFGDNLPLTTSQPAPLSWDYHQLDRKPDAHQPKELVDKYFRKEK